MFRTITAVFGLSIAVFGVSAAAASSVTTETVEFEDDIDDSEGPPSIVPANANAQFGPFFVMSDTLVEMAGVVDSSTPGQFQRMMARFPGLTMLRMIECPGSEDDDANLILSRMLHQAGLSTHVPANGSIRSGAVELFLAGVHRTSEPGAQFGVHSWQDEYGREATDYPASDPVHQAYVNYYIAMGFPPAEARNFYAFTNHAAPSSGVHYMTRAELAQYHLTN
jgi:hypothetical protein